MAYATVDDVQARMTREMSHDEKTVCATLLQDAAVLIDAYAKDASEDAKRVVSCRVVMRAIGDGEPSGVPMGATQGSMSGLGYSQSWTFGSGGGVGDLFLAKSDKALLCTSNKIGSHSPVEEMAVERDPWWWIP